jgi:hypothetical protein
MEQCFYNKSITIAILDFSLFDSLSYQHLFHLWDVNDRIQLTDIIEIHALELPKVPLQEAGDEGLLLNWLRLFKAQRLEEYEMLAIKDPAIKKTVD